MWYATVEKKKRGKLQRALPPNKSGTSPGNLKNYISVALQRKILN